MEKDDIDEDAEELLRALIIKGVEIIKNIKELEKKKNNKEGLWRKIN